MGKPTTKFFGSVNLTQLKAAVAALPNKVDEYNGDKQFKIAGSLWDDGNVTFDVWDKENKVAYKLGSLRVSKFDDEASAVQEEKADDLPF